MTHAEANDLLELLLGWARAAATAHGSEQLDFQHLLLGALKQAPTRDLLAELVGSDLPKRQADYPQRLRELVDRSTAPVMDRQLPLTPRLREVAGAIMRERGGLDARSLLQQAVERLRAESDWQEMFFAPAQALPLAPVGAGLLRRTGAAVGELRGRLRSRVLGQEQAVEAVCDAYFTAALQTPGTADTRPRGPRMILTFVGPPGVGKTYLAEELAEHLAATEGEKAGLLRLDMSAYAGHQAHEPLAGSDAVYRGSSPGLLTGFVAAHPHAVILVDEIEKAHHNTQNLFLQILDAGRLYEHHGKRDVDFSGTTFVFTTNLGQELYDAPNRLGVLEDAEALSEALAGALVREARAEKGGLAPELVSRLAKGRLILFRRLDGLALERLADLTVRQVAAELSAAAGVSLEVVDPVLSTLFVLRFSAGGDGRRLTAGLRNFLFGTVRDVLEDGALSDPAGAGQAPASKPAPRIRMKGLNAPVDGPAVLRLRLGEGEVPTAIGEALQRQLHVLIIDDDEWGLDLVDGLTAVRVSSQAAADERLRAGGVDLVLLDLHIGAGARARGMDQGMLLLRWLRQRYADVPVYLFSESPGRRGLSPEVLERVSREGGARGVLPKDFAGSPAARTGGEVFLQRLQAMAAELRRHELVRRYQRRLQSIHFEVEAAPASGGGSPELVVRRVREVTSVTASDRNSMGWVDLPTVRFADLAGAERAKQRLMEVVRWLRDPSALRRFGIDVPRGMLLTGPPGTGKTSLARATAGEAQVPFFAISGSEVFSKWVGESEAAVRGLFQRARRYAPAVVFIDEIDSLGAQRGRSAGNEHRDAVLNELLAQMDGFARGDRPVFVLAATNRPDILDPALLRPGRFDGVIEVPNPDPVARQELFRRLLAPRPHAAEIDIAGLVDRTAGMSGADIEQVCREAAMQALRRGGALIEETDLQEAVTILRMGFAAERPLLSPGVRWATAVHEAGHALAQHLLFPEEPVTQVSILPRRGAAGFAEHAAGSQYQDLTAARVGRRVRVLLAGRVAEELLLGAQEISAGCEDDLRRASALAGHFVLRWGMDEEAGLLSLQGLQEALGGGLDLGATGSGTERLARVEGWLREQRQQTIDLLRSRSDQLDALARQLVERETLYRDDIATLLGAEPQGAL